MRVVGLSGSGTDNQEATPSTLSRASSTLKLSAVIYAVPVTTIARLNVESDRGMLSTSVRVTFAVTLDFAGST